MAANEWRAGWSERTHGCEALEGSARPREAQLRGGTTPRALPKRRTPGSRREQIGEKASAKSREIGSPSCGAAACRVRRASMRKKVMGHETPLLRRQFAGCRGFRFLWRPLPLLQPTRKHGFGAFVDPLVEKRGNLLAKIGGVSKTGEFKALQRVARGREKELPRGLSSGARHRGPPG
jgi:hypothetical protein